MAWIWKTVVTGLLVQVNRNRPAISTPTPLLSIHPNIEAFTGLYIVDPSHHWLEQYATGLVG